MQVVQKGPIVLVPTSTSHKEDIALEGNQSTESLDSVETVKVRPPILRETHTPGEPTDNTSDAIEVVQMLRSKNSDETSKLGCVLEQELSNISRVSLIKTILTSQFPCSGTRACSKCERHSYVCYIMGYSKVAHPLYLLTETGSSFLMDNRF